VGVFVFKRVLAVFKAAHSGLSLNI
jgi:hypothetical protein